MPKPEVYLRSDKNQSDDPKNAGWETCDEPGCERRPIFVSHENHRDVRTEDPETQKTVTKKGCDERFWCKTHFEMNFHRKNSEEHGFTAIEYVLWLKEKKKKRKTRRKS